MSNAVASFRKSNKRLTLNCLNHLCLVFTWFYIAIVLCLYCVAILWCISHNTLSSYWHTHCVHYTTYHAQGSTLVSLPGIHLVSNTLDFDPTWEMTPAQIHNTDDAIMCSQNEISSFVSGLIIVAKPFLDLPSLDVFFIISKSQMSVWLNSYYVVILEKIGWLLNAILNSNKSIEFNVVASDFCSI